MGRVGSGGKVGGAGGGGGKAEKKSKKKAGKVFYDKVECELQYEVVVMS